MKTRESGMPEENVWDEFFDAGKILDELEVDVSIEKLADLGCGYGTFALPAGRKIKGTVYALDVEEGAVKDLEKKIKKKNIRNVTVMKKDFVADGTGFGEGEVNYVMLFNILHAEESENILREAYRILKENGKTGIIHWRYDDCTPRGPSMAIRPRPEDLKRLLIKTGFEIIKFNINLPPYHYGILAIKK